MANRRHSGPKKLNVSCLTTDLVSLKPSITLTLDDIGTDCYVIDATTTPPSVASIFIWYGTDWAIY